MEAHEQIYRFLIFGDTHGYLKEIPYIKRIEDYDYFLYLGDGYEEVEEWAQKNNLNDKFVAVTGNCDYAPLVARQKLIEVNNVKIFLTHGDIFSVKSSYDLILDKAKSAGASIALFGHTHYADHQIIDGVHLFNPGSIIPRGRDYASVGYLEIKNNQIITLDHLAF